MLIKACVFDAYGTLFDVNAAARIAAKDQDWDQHWQALAAHWRSKQLQYTWLRAITEHHTDFWHVTQDALDWALDRTGLACDPALRQKLLDLYWSLAPFPEVSDMLQRLKSDGQTTAILSNGSKDMLKAAVVSAGLSDLLDDTLSVDDAGIFKPSAKVYDLVGARFGLPREHVLFVSSNGWDVCSAAAYGFRTVWVNRANEPMDRLPVKPETTLPDLNHIPDLIS